MRGERRFTLLAILIASLASGCGVRREAHRETVAKWTDARLYSGRMTNLAAGLEEAQAAELRLHDFAHREDIATNALEADSGVILDRPQIVGLDGEWLKQPLEARSLLKPGVHSINVITEVRAERMTPDRLRMTFDPKKLQFLFEGGHVYDLYTVSGPAGRQPLLYRDGAINRENLFGLLRREDLSSWVAWLWVEDNQNKQLVAGNRPQAASH